MILSGDTPLLRPETLRALVARRRERGLDARDPLLPSAGAGRLRPRRARRARRGAPRSSRRGTRRRSEAKIAEVNAGVYCFAPEALARALARLERDRTSGEFYLTDAVEHPRVAAGPRRGRRGGRLARGLGRQHAARPRGRRGDRAPPRRRARARRGRDAARSGDDPHRARRHARAGRRAPPVRLPRGRDVDRRGRRDPAVHADRRLARRGAAPSSVRTATLERRPVGARARVGPFSRVRPGLRVEEDVRVGNFVETKNTVLRARRQGAAPRLPRRRRRSARGPTSARASSPATTTARRSTARGSGRRPSSAATSQLVAPVSVGDGAYVGAGTTVTAGRPGGGAGALAARPRPTRKAGSPSARRSAQAKPER